MVIVNFKVVMGASDTDGLIGLLVGALQGRAAATFVVLAGIGLGLAASRVDAPGSATVLTLKRAAFLLAVGLLNTLIFDADIIHYYAFYFLIGAFVLRLGQQALLLGVLAVNAVFIVLVVVLNYDHGWDWDALSYAEFWTPAGFVRNLFFNGWHPVIPWISFLLFGIVLSRLRLVERACQWSLVLGGTLAIVVAHGVSIAISPVLTSIDAELVWFASTQPIPPMPLYIVAGLGAATATIGACLLLSDWAQRNGVLDAVAPAGRQTLTLYLAHILIGMSALQSLGLLGGQSAMASLTAALVFCAGATLVAWLWSRRFRRGPVETLMRRMAG